MTRPLLVLVLLVHSVALAQPELSNAVGPTLGELRTLTNDQDYPAALAVLGPALAKTQPDSYDRFVLLQIQGRILIAQNQLPAALQSLESAHALTGQHPDYLDDTTRPEFLQLLAQLQFQVATDQPTPAAKTTGYQRALDTTRAWLATLPTPDANARYFAASLRYSLANVTPDHPDKTLLADALNDVHAGLLTQLDPPRQLRLLGVAILQQLGRTTETIPQLELLVQQQPGNASLWSQLAATYQSSPTRENQLRTILTYERAQAAGRLTDTTSRLNLIHAYLKVEAHEKARQLLADGLHTGTIESTARSWQFLATLQQEHGTPDTALATLREALTRFPENQNLALELARQLNTRGQNNEAYRIALAATQDPAQLEHPGRALTYLAYLAYELGDHTAAARHLDDAATHDDARPDDLARLRAALKQP